MATKVLTNAYFLLNTVNLSTYVRGIDESFTTDTPEDTAMGDTSRTYVVGLDNRTFSVDLNLELGAGAVEATLWAVHDGRAAVAFEYAADGSTEGAANPVYSGNCILTQWNPISGQAGQAGQVRAQFQITGDVTRDITP